MEQTEKNSVQANISEAKAETAGRETEMESLRKKYKQIDGKIYEIVTSIQEDDENEKEFDFIFRKPGTPSYDRYVKTSGHPAQRR